MTNYNELVKQYKQLAKKADRQLRALEDLSKQEHYKGVLKYAYARAEKDIKAFEYGQDNDKPRFSRNIPRTSQGVQARINDVMNFLESSTNTKRKITSVYRQRAKTVNEKYGTNFKWQDLANYYESKHHDILDSKYGSNSLIKSLGNIKKLSDKPEDIQKILEHNIKIDDDEIVDEITKQLLRDGYTKDNLFGGN